MKTCSTVDLMINADIKENIANLLYKCRSKDLNLKFDGRRNIYLIRNCEKEFLTESIRQNNQHIINSCVSSLIE